MLPTFVIGLREGLEAADALGTALGPYRRGDGFVRYDELSTGDTRTLSQAIDALAEPLSGVGSIVVAR